MNDASAKAVLISDVHYSLKTYQLADQAFRMAIDKAAELKVPLIDCGDLTNDKAILRGEVVNTILKTVEYAREKLVSLFFLVGNHSLVSEKGDEDVLHFLEPYDNVIVIRSPASIGGFNFIPYQNSSDKMLAALTKFKKGSLIIAHQGLQGAFLGDYVTDKTSLPPSAFADYRICSGHYHRSQSIKCGPPRKGAVGLFSYIGNPYSLSWGESGDGPKGFQILGSDGLLTQVPTNLRKHVKLEWTTEMLSGVGSLKRGEPEPSVKINPEDLVWLKLTGPESELALFNKKVCAEVMGVQNFKLDKIPTEVTRMEETKESLTEAQIMDRLIDQTEESLEEKKNLKGLWRETLT